MRKKRNSNNEDLKLNVICTRISDEEKSALQEISRRSHTTISHLLREAMLCYTSSWENRVSPS